MNFPKLKTRPRSTHTVYRFGGLWHNDEAPVGMTAKTVMRWKDLLDIGPDKYPMLSRKPDGTAAVSIDGNVINQPLIGAADGEHPVFLDELGTLYCNGHTLPLFFGHGEGGLLDPGNRAFWTVRAKRSTSGNVLITDEDLLWNMMNFDFSHRTDIVLTATDGTHLEYDDDIYSAAEYGLAISPTLAEGETITITFLPAWAGAYIPLVRIGACVVDMRYRRYCNVEDLAAGNTMTEGDNYGDLDAFQSADMAAEALTVTLTLCHKDGTPYSGIIAQSTAPDPDSYKYWIDTSGDKSVAMEYSTSMSMWVVISSTYVKISGIPVAEHANSSYGEIKTGDAVQMHGYNQDAGMDEEVSYLLNAFHQVVEAAVTVPATGFGYIIVAGVLPDDTVTLQSTDVEYITISRTAPVMDYVVEAGNRLWGCRYDMANKINEIYCSKLGDFKNWSVYQGLSTDSWAASRGTPAPYTGAAVLDGHPLFFREESLEKVYPASTGAHQIQTFTVDGVQEGSDRSLVIIDDRLYYQSRLGVCVYDGTLPRKISEAFGDLKYSQGIAARHLKRYCISMVPAVGGDRIVGVYDTGTGEWYLESGGWDCLAFCWKEELYSSSAGNLYIWKRYSNTASHGTWYAESGVIGYELPEHRFISCVQIRMRSQLMYGTTVKVKIMYDDSGTWIEKGSYALGTKIGSKEVNILPQRCDHFRIRLEGTGGADVLSMSFRMERSEGGH